MSQAATDALPGATSGTEEGSSLLLLKGQRAWPWGLTLALGTPWISYFPSWISVSM